MNEHYAKGYAAGVKLAISLEAQTIEQTIKRLEHCMELVSRRVDFLKGNELEREQGTYDALYQAHDKLSTILIERNL